MKKSTLSLLTILLLTSCNIPTDSSNNNSSILEDSSTLSNQVSSTPEETTTPEVSSTPEDSSTPEETLKASKLFFVGDSTVCSFEDAYYYPRYGYGTQIHKYLKEEMEVVNLALSGRSSKSFLLEENYNTLKTSISAGDYLFIGFGHNDEKAEAARYTNPNTGVNEEGSFKKSLYDNYIKLALDAGATPILATPIVRLSNSDNYTGNNIHITTGSGSEYPGGDYSKAIVELGNEKDIDVVDLTTMTKELYTADTYVNAKYYHAWLSTKESSVDKTHLNIYGASVVSYLIASTLANSDNSIKDYILDNISLPSKEDTLVSNPDYVEPTYQTPTASSQTFITTAPWWASVFGDCGGASKISEEYYTIKENDDGSVNLKAGNYDPSTMTTTSSVGKVSGSAGDGLAMYFRPVDAEQDFELSVTAHVSYIDLSNNQCAFGLMLRDDMYVDEFLGTQITGNYVASGTVNLNKAPAAVFSKTEGKLSTELTASSKVAHNEDVTLSIKRVGDTITCTYNSQSYSYSAKDLTTVDALYDYVGLFVSRCADVTFSNIVFTLL